MFNSNIKTVKFNLRSLFLIVFSMALLSCGGGDGDSDGDGGSSSSSSGGSSSSSSGGTSSSSSSGGVSAEEPVTPLISNQQASTDFFGSQLNVTGEGGSDGDIEVVFNDMPAPATLNIKLAMQPEEDFESVIPKLQLKNGVSSITITNIQRTTAADFLCQNGNDVKGFQNSNFVSGSVNTQGTVNGSSLSCTSTFQSVLPNTIPGLFSVMGLLEEWGSDDDVSKPIEETGLVSTDCPQDDSGIMGIDPILDVCSGNILSNFVVTDINGNIHKASTKITFQFTGTVDFPDITDISGGFLLNP